MMKSTGETLATQYAERTRREFLTTSASGLGMAALVARARALADVDDLRLAGELIELAVQAAPDDRNAHRARAEIYDRRRKSELSLMARGIYGSAARESAARADVEE